MKKQKILSAQENALAEMLDARDELRRVETLFNYVDNDFFEIANMELTIAQMKYKLSVSKLKKICGEDVEIPQMNIFYAASEF